MNSKFITLLGLLCCIFIGSCSSDDEKDNLSVFGIWNATALVEDAVYTDLGKEEHNQINIDYGNYIWELKEDGQVRVTGEVEGSYQWYNKGEKPTDYQTFIYDNNQMKLLFSFSDTSKSPFIYDILQLTESEMVLRDTATWHNVGEGEVVITRTITLNKIN